MQTRKLHPRCTGGGKEAEELFLLGLGYSKGLNGLPRDIQKALRLYEEALELGNPKAAINLGTLYRTAFAREHETRVERYAYMNALYKHAIDMGCPDGYYYLAGSYDSGWGVPRDAKKTDALILEGLEAGSFICMAAYGTMLENQGNSTEAKKWLHRALDGGFFEAAMELKRIYLLRDKDYPRGIAVLRQGASQGGMDAILNLGGIYADGDYNQPQDLAYAECFLKLFRSIDVDAPPRAIDLDRLCPPREVVPYNGEKKQ